MDAFDLNILVVCIHSLVCAFAIMLCPRSVLVFTSFSTAIPTVGPPLLTLCVIKLSRDIFLGLGTGLVLLLVLMLRWLLLLHLLTLCGSDVVRLWEQAVGALGFLDAIVILALGFECLSRWAEIVLWRQVLSTFILLVVAFLVVILLVVVLLIVLAVGLELLSGWAGVVDSACSRDCALEMF